MKKLRILKKIFENSFLKNGKVEFFIWIAYCLYLNLLLKWKLEQLSKYDFYENSSRNYEHLITNFREKIWKASLMFLSKIQMKYRNLSKKALKHRPMLNYEQTLKTFKVKNDLYCWQYWSGRFCKRVPRKSWLMVWKMKFYKF